MNRRQFIKGLSGIVLSSSLYSFNSETTPKNNFLNNENIRILDDNEFYTAKAYSQGFRVSDAILIEIELKQNMNLMFLNTRVKKYPDYKWEFKGQYPDVNFASKDYFPDYTPETIDHSFMSNFIYSNNKAYTLIGTDRHCPAQKIELNLRMYSDELSLFKPRNVIKNCYEIYISERIWGTGYIPTYDPNAPNKSTPEKIAEYHRLESRELVDLPKSWQGNSNSYDIMNGFVKPRPECGVYGNRRFYFIKGRSLRTSWPRNPHMGVDCSGNKGSPIKAALSGKIKFLDTNLLFIGSVAVIDHGLGLYTTYGHMNKQYVALDQVVEKGQIIGSVGSNGISTAPHLHFNAKLHSMNIDPLSLDVLNKVFHD